VASANPHTIVVLESGSPVTMPWIDKVAGVIEAWYPGIRGAEALAEIMVGRINPSAKLAITFPKDDSDLPHPKLVMPPPESVPPRRTGADGAAFMSSMAKGLPPFQVYYDEKLEVGYKWYDAMKKPVLFPFGFGLSYSKYQYSSLAITPGQTTSVTFSVKNAGGTAGTEIAQIYTSLPSQAGEPPKRLVGWSRIKLLAGESRQVSIPISDERFKVYDEASDSWRLVAGDYTIRVGGSSQDLPLEKLITLK
jgi:beta-glucosidase